VEPGLTGPLKKAASRKQKWETIGKKIAVPGIDGISALKQGTTKVNK
jgi:hypothetical protein